MVEIYPLGKIDTLLLEQEFGMLQTDEVVVTSERIEHIKVHHPEDYELFERYGFDAVQDPDYIVRDMKNEGTVFLVKKLPDTNLNVVSRLALGTDKAGLKNSVMTFFRLREKNLRKMLQKHKLLYKRE